MNENILGKIIKLIPGAQQRIIATEVPKQEPITQELVYQQVFF
jgi:hypothetical protein